MSSKSLSQLDEPLSVCAEKDADEEYVLVHWYLQQHGSFSSGGRWRDIILKESSSSKQLTDYLLEYIKKNYPHVDIIDQQYSVIDLCRIAIDESNKLLVSNLHEISRVTSRHIWPPNHQLLMGCLENAHIVATYHDQFAATPRVQPEEQENDDTTYCLITQLGNHPTHLKFLRGTSSLREEILHRFEHPFQTTCASSQEQIDLFRHKSERLSIQEFCDYVSSRHWYNLENHSLYGILVDFIIAGRPLLFNEHID